MSSSLSPFIARAALALSVILVSLCAMVLPVTLFVAEAFVLEHSQFEQLTTELAHSNFWLFAFSPFLAICAVLVTFVDMLHRQRISSGKAIGLLIIIMLLSVLATTAYWGRELGILYKDANGKTR